jgi:serine/threonine protein kinase
MRESPPFSEDATQQITRQLVDGIKLMHDCGFAHRDLKPGVGSRLSNPKLHEKSV